MQLYSPGSTIYKRISEVLPGTILQITVNLFLCSGGNPSFLDLVKSQDDWIHDFTDFIRRYKQDFAQMHPTVPSIYGVDSSSVVSMMSRLLTTPVSTFSIS